MSKKSPKKALDTKQEAAERWQAEVESSQRKREDNKHLLAEARKDPKKAGKLKAAMAADLVRVASIPGPLGPSTSRNRYRELGHFSEALVPFLYGNHQEFQRAAGVRDLRGTTKVQNKAALLHTHQQIAAYAERELKPWAGAFDKTKGRKHLEVVIGSDFHSQFVSRFGLRVWLDFIKWSQPDVVVLNGDVVDFPHISRHRKLPGHFHWNLQDEIDFARKEILSAVRAAAPNATILFVIGNHEYRLVNYLADTAPALAGLRSLRFNDLFGLRDFEIGLVCRSNFLAPYAQQKKQDQLENWHVLGECYVVTHGLALGKIASAEQLARYQMSGTSGHTHRPQIYCGNTMATGPISWMSTPAMAELSVGRDYDSGPSAWNTGGGRAVIHRKQVTQELLIIHPTWAEIAGRMWEATPKEIAARAALKEVM